MKYHPHGSVLFATFTIAQGVLLLCNPLCEAILKNYLARAQFMYPVRVVAFLIVLCMYLNRHQLSQKLKIEELKKTQSTSIQLIERGLRMLRIFYVTL